MFASLLLLFSGGALADEPRSVAITFSPLHLVIPFVELTAEARATDQLGLALVAGGGSSLGVGIAEMGFQGRYYAIGDFSKGMQLGVEGLVVSGGLTEGTVTARGLSLSAGPFVGYKSCAASGFTFDTQLGLAGTLTRATGTDGGTSVTQNETAVDPLLNLNIGWSF